MFLKSFVVSAILTLSIDVRLKVTSVFCILNSNGIDYVKELINNKILHETKHSITTIYVKDTCNIILHF